MRPSEPPQLEEPRPPRNGLRGWESLLQKQVAAGGLAAMFLFWVWGAFDGLPGVGRVMPSPVGRYEHSSQKIVTQMDSLMALKDARDRDIENRQETLLAMLRYLCVQHARDQEGQKICAGWMFQQTVPPVAAPGGPR